MNENDSDFIPMTPAERARLAHLAAEPPSAPIRAVARVFAIVFIAVSVANEIRGWVSPAADCTAPHEWAPRDALER
jgi:hypothetical protein